MSKFLKNIGGFSLGPIVGAILSFITVPLITHFISPDEYGKASMFVLAQSTLSTVVYLGMDQSFVREFNLFKNDVQKLMINALCIPMVMVTIFSGSIVIFADKVSQILFSNENEVLAVYSLAALLPFMVIEQFALLKIRMEEKGLIYSIFTILLKVTILVLTVILFLEYQYSFRSVIYAAALAEIINGIALYIFALSKYRLSKDMFDRALQRRMINFGLPLVPAFAISWILTSMDKVMLRTMCNYEELGLYSAAFKIVSVLSVLQACFTLYWTPVAYRWYEGKKSIKHFEVVANLIAVLMTIVCLGILLLKNIVSLILGKDFESAILIFPFLLLYPVLYTMSETTALGIGFKRKTGYNIIIAMISGGTNILMNWLLIPKFAGIGAAMATGISYIVFFWGRTLISGKLWHKMDIGFFAVINLIVFGNCVVHTFAHGYIAYTVTLITVLILVAIIFAKCNGKNIIKIIKNGELFEQESINPWSK